MPESFEPHTFEPVTSPVEQELADPSFLQHVRDLGGSALESAQASFQNSQNSLRVGASVLAFAGGGLALAKRAEAGTQATPAPVTHRVQSFETPSEILHESDKGLDGYTGGSYFELGSLYIAKNSLDAEGVCYTPSYRKAFQLDTAASTVTSCDPSQPVASISPPDPGGLAYVNKQLDKIGYNVAEQVQKLGGTHTASNISETASKVEADYTCTPNKPGIQKAEINSDGKAIVTDCPVAIPTAAGVNTKDPSYKRAIKKYLADPFRSGEKWVGDQGRYSMFGACPRQTLHQDPRLVFGYNAKKRAVSVGFDGGQYFQYCDIVGKYTERVSTQIKRPGAHRFKQLGNSVLHTDGLREVLVYNYGLSEKYQRNWTRIRGTSNLCKNGQNRNAEVRVKIHEKFTGDQSQTFEHAFRSNNGRGIQSSSVLLFSRSKNICK